MVDLDEVTSITQITVRLNTQMHTDVPLTTYKATDFIPIMQQR